ncbi:MAG: hypothetical protein S4CHLAM81_08620 [Chlamydiales bacterium]|nr:hypothetical protein [Chlamydiales bacterium]MCH9635643.1 hypothetical protein [Chlamydiales bacterium]MCH9703349.1 50S ribosomal protein L21 [Chlamydiota bacterium]
MTKYAVIQSGAKQYRVCEGDVIDVELLEGDDKNVEFDMLFLNDGKDIKVGEPILDVKAQGEVLGPVRGPKVIAFKYKRRKSSTRRKVGHRQDYLRVKILGFGGVTKAAAPVKKVAAKKAAPKAAAKKAAAPKAAAKKAPAKKAAAKKAAPKKAAVKKKTEK